MIVKDHIQHILKEAVQLAMATHDQSFIELGDIEIEIPKKEEHGDFATNFALKASKKLGVPPRDLAQTIIEKIQSLVPDATLSVAGPGFINIKMPSSFWQNYILDIVKQGQSFGKTDYGQHKSVNIEFVSGNPTGPLHIGHVRGAVIGQIISNILEYSGYDVTREYYINDAGLQVEKLARSTYLRYREALGEHIEDIPEGLYPGDYLIQVGQDLVQKYGSKWLDTPEDEWIPIFREDAISAMMALIKKDLKELDIYFDLFSSEKALITEGKVDSALDELLKRDLIYTGTLPKPQSLQSNDDWTPEELLLFRSTQFGDEIDRPLKKVDGQLTYFASDIAYHYDKFMRNHERLINIWGADHGGYIPRLSSAVSAITDNKCQVEIKTCQMVKLTRGGEEIKMSKRAGTFVTLQDLIGEVGKDVIFFTVATKSSNTQFNFDLDAVTKQSMDNPVYYVQYAHARASSVLRKAADTFDIDLSSPDYDLRSLKDPQELSLIRKMSHFTHLIQLASEKLEPHIITDYLYELSSSFHSLWNSGKKNDELRFIQEENLENTVAKVLLVKAFQTVIANGLRCSNVVPMDTMERAIPVEDAPENSIKQA